MLFLFIWIIVACMFVAVYTRTVCFVCLWNGYYRISRSLIDSLLVLICMLSLLIWIIIAGMLVAVLPEVICYYDCEMIYFLYPDHWLIFHLLSFFQLWINVASMLFAVSQEVINLYDFEMIVTLYRVNCLIFYSLLSLWCCFLFESL